MKKKNILDNYGPADRVYHQIAVSKTSKKRTNYYFKSIIMQLIKGLLILFLCFINGNAEIKVKRVELDDGPVFEITYDEPYIHEEDFPMGYVPPVLDNPSIVTQKSPKDILNECDIFYKELTRGKTINFPNEKMARLNRFISTYDIISRMRFRRGVNNLLCQKGITEVVEHIQDSRWFKEFLVPVSSNPIYDYSEDTALRIIISIHTACHFFQIPFPTLMCLFFQESKFDFKIKSHTGALGLGQLTNIGIKQVTKLRKDPIEERRLKAASIHLNSIYRDTVIDTLLREMGFYPMFPELGDLPDKIKKFSPYQWRIIKEVSKELVDKGYKYGKNYRLLRKLIIKDLRGGVLTGKYAAVHPALLKVTDLHFGKKYGTVLNIETNILFSSMLLKHYMDYKWSVGRKKLKLQPCLRATLAIASYNQGPGIVIQCLKYIKRRYPKLNLETIEPEDVKKIFTKKAITSAFKGKSSRVNELFKHVWAVRKCSEKEFSKVK